MRHSKRESGIFKRSVAVMLGITLALGTLMLPDSAVQEEFTAASAYSVEVNDCEFEYTIVEREGAERIRVTNVTFTGDTVEIPSVITHNGTDYPVTDIGDRFLENNKDIKTVKIPDSVTYIGNQVLNYSSAEKIILSNNLEHIGTSFASNCFSLASIECSHLSLDLDDVGNLILQNCFKMKNEKGAVCIANWLFDYEPSSKDITYVKVSDLGNDGIKIDTVANSAAYRTINAVTLDLEGVKYIGRGNFKNFKKLKEIINDESITEVGDTSFSNTPWFNEAKENGLVKIGNILLYYKTDSNIIDLTAKELSGVKKVPKDSLAECTNADILFCGSDCVLNSGCFYMTYDPESEGTGYDDKLPETPYHKIKKINVDGKELTYSAVLENDDLKNWLLENMDTLQGTQFFNNIVQAKTEVLFKQLDIPYYGIYNDKTGSHTPSEEFSIRLKIHDYMSQYQYDQEIKDNNALEVFLSGGKLSGCGYAYLTQYLTECAGLEAKTLVGKDHLWNETKIGNEWFEFDESSDGQADSHRYTWFGLSSFGMYSMDHENNICSGAYDSIHISWNDDNESERELADRIIGDVDDDDNRTQNDADMMWGYLKGRAVPIDEKAADINLDGNIDVTDGVLLEHILHRPALDMDNIPDDGLAAGYWVAFVNGDDYDNIKYSHTDREGYLVLPYLAFEAPAGKTLSYDIGNVGDKVRITTPLTVIQTKWIDESKPDSSSPDSSKPESSNNDSVSRPDNSSSDSSSPDKKNSILGDVNGDGAIDIEDAVAIIQHINGVTPLTADEESRADVSKDKNIDIDDAVTLISYINGNSTF